MSTKKRNVKNIFYFFNIQSVVLVLGVARYTCTGINNAFERKGGVGGRGGGDLVEIVVAPNDIVYSAHSVWFKQNIYSSLQCCSILQKYILDNATSNHLFKAFA